MSTNNIDSQTASLIAELRDPRLLSMVEVEAYARRLRTQALASAAVAFVGWVKRSFATQAPASSVEPVAAPVPAYDLRQLEADVRYQRAEAFAEVIYQATKLVERLFAPITARIKAALARQAAMAELYGLDDRTLYDMGLTRSEIPAAVAGDIYRPHAPKLDAAQAASDAANENAGFKLPLLGRKVVA
ncbi:DUF1127 domain-containing protein [Ferrovibrio sp.]|uniref:DUF1127 domain-containing protein n=1 Tax=Ferrovibrio sp. TaxID=1917215 RepID=UPI001B7613F6|nr:DUF1127 domain-containing protein [Ferrovibrio sp.]MBP7065389.1 DUF1127 domain-containing protein [Ferrovibrio sp.]